MNIKIMEIKNDALLQAAKNANTNVDDNVIDECEIIKFKTDADEIFRNKNCTSDEYKNIFGFYPAVENTVANGRLGEINNKLSKNLTELKHLQGILNQKELRYSKYSMEASETNKNIRSTVAFAGLGGLFTTILGGFAYMDNFVDAELGTVGKFLAKNIGKIGLATLGLAVACGAYTLFEDKIVGKKPEVQEQMREYYQNKFNKLMQENAELTLEKEKLTVAKQDNKPV